MFKMFPFAKGFFFNFGLVAVMLLAVSEQLSAQPIGSSQLDGKTLPKYVEPLPTFVGTRVDASGGNLTITMKELSEQILPSANPALGIAGYPQTTVWGYEITNGTTTYPAHYPAFTIEARRGIPLTVTYFNKLGNQTLYKPVSSTAPGILPVDQTLHWADPLNTGHTMNTYAGPVPTVPHLHGGEVQSTSDGGPDAWFTPDNDPDYSQIHGPAWGQGVTNVYHYPNDQEAATIWWHDHALGATRLNVYAGLAGFYFLRDNRDNGLPNNPLRLPAGNYEIELAIQDKMFDTEGRLFFPHESENPEVHPFWSPEFFGDVIVVNGKTWPFLNVEPRRYRFRLLDGSNARFYDFDLMDVVNRKAGPAIWQIGTDGGLLDMPVMIAQNSAKAPLKSLLMAPGERCDVIIDFSAFAGQSLTLLNHAKAPYPKGDAPDPNTVGQIMQFRVGTTITGGADNSYDPATLAPLRSDPIVNLASIPPDVIRQLTLFEVQGGGGPLEVLVNNTKWMAPISERPTEGNTELWQIINLTADAHPMHLHLTQFQLVSRQPFGLAQYLKAYGAAFPGGVSPVDGQTYPPGTVIPGFGPPMAYGSAGETPILGGNPDVTPFLRGKARPADANERGWKDTYKMYPGEVATVVVRFAPTDLPVTTPKANLVFGFDPSVGPGYVWHCHIVDHEDNEMMRPYAVQPNPSRGASGMNVVAAPGGALPIRFGLDQNYPNPFNPTTEIKFDLPVATTVSLKVFNIYGQLTRTLVDEVEYSAGTYKVGLDASDLASGVYICRLTTSSAFTSTKKMLLMR
jgi:FtsP/CotA-like multicopper oxidase with cupredoxin domain